MVNRNANIIAVIHKGKIVEKVTHSELLGDPEGAYSQLIRLQEMNKDATEQPSSSGVGKNKVDASSMGSHHRQSSQKMPFLLSISRPSSGVGSSRHHSISASFGVPTVSSLKLGVQDLPLLTNL
ncbi:hypothetical protein Leryth_004861 [Lithospermum erythrorhizon]|nr:hypothetical protein Leryth_004861 [Lithospermum erythrorhizon]